MLIPVIDHKYNDRRTPAVLAIVITNFFIFVLFNFRSDYATDFIWRVGLIPAEISIDSLFSHMFFHANWFHVVGNMFYLWFFGRNVERKLGWHFFLGIYFCSGLLAGISQAAAMGDAHVPMIGASGAVMGILGAYLAMFPKRRIDCVYTLLFQTGSIKVIAGLFIFIYFAVDLLFALTVSSATGTAHWAHVGGMVVGAAVAHVLVKVLRFRGFEEIIQITENKDRELQDFSELDYIPDGDNELGLPPIDPIKLEPLEEMKPPPKAPQRKRRFKRR